MGKLRPFVRKDSYMPNKKWIPFVIGNGYTTTDGAGGPAPEYETVTGNPVSFNAITPLPLRQLSVAFSPVQSGSGDPSPDNVRPILGWDSLNVEMRGVNVWDGEYEQGNILSDGSDGTSTGYNRIKGYVPIKGGKSYYMVHSDSSDRFFYYDKDKNFLLVDYNHNPSTAPQNAAYMRSMWNKTNVPTPSETVSINYPATDTAYHAYNPLSRSISISLGSTVYSGYVDVVTGVGEVTWAAVDLSELAWRLSQGDTTVYYTDDAIPNVKTPLNGGIKANAICEKYAIKPSNDVVANLSQGVGVRPNGKIYATDFGSSPTGIMAYELATPIPISLTPQEVQSLAGDNVLFSDANGDLTVTYRSN